MACLHGQLVSLYLGQLHPTQGQGGPKKVAGEQKDLRAKRRRRRAFEALKLRAFDSIHVRHWDFSISTCMYVCNCILNDTSIIYRWK